MRLVTFQRQEAEDKIGVLRGDRVLDLAAAAGHAGQSAATFQDMTTFLEAGERAMDLARSLAESAPPESASYPLSGVRLRPPVPRPGKIIALGLNYRDHSLEQGVPPPSTPLIFAKFPTSITGPYDPILIPEGDPQVDYEAELAVVIGRRGKMVPASQAMSFVAGYMALNDVSARQWQFSDKQWVRGKSCDTFCPVGPWLTTTDQVPDPHALNIAARVNGQTLQNSNTRHLIFRIPGLITFISASITLEPGDIIATGTPDGVGVFRKPPIFLKPGDIVEVEIESLGTLKNPVAAAPVAGPHSDHR
jgi:acylpyruvate hydrolase